jgi:hypothetical protein
MKEIPLTQGQIALVDDADYDWLNQFKWCAERAKQTYYARGRASVDGKTVLIRMHVLIAGPRPDHKDGNGLNNQRHNLRRATSAQNARNKRRSGNNTSGYKGVSFSKKAKGWRARIKTEGRERHLGVYLTPEAAALAYNDAAEIYHGEFKSLNDVPESARGLSTRECRKQRGWNRAANANKLV